MERWVKVRGREAEREYVGESGCVCVRVWESDREWDIERGCVIGTKMGVFRFFFSFSVCFILFHFTWFYPIDHLINYSIIYLLSNLQWNHLFAYYFHLFSSKLKCGVLNPEDFSVLFFVHLIFFIIFSRCVTWKYCLTLFLWFTEVFSNN